MQRWITVLVGLAVVALAFWLVARNYRPPQAIGHAPTPYDAPDGNARRGTTSASDDAATAPGEGAPGVLNDLPADLLSDGGAGTTMPDGSPVPGLPTTAPRQARFGVVLVTYVGAQPSAGGARPAGRSKWDAKILSDRLFITAEQDFHAAVQLGDVGSADDIGQVKLGILEPAPEYVLFTLAVHAVGGPVDTPRGYWIVKRLE